MVSDLIILCIVSFFAGFIDAIVGGGGLLQTPAIMIVLPQYPVATLFSTTKIPSLSGTAFAAWKYSQNVKLNWGLLIYIALAAFTGALFGAYSITLIDNQVIKPAVLVILILVAVYTYFNKKFGVHQEKEHTVLQQVLIGLLFGFVIGFYDGLIGPGTGTFFILAFIALMGYDFLHASAGAKLINMATNIAAICYFGSTGHILYELAIPMAVCNVGGSFLGTKLALLKGNKFIRIFFLIVVFGTILRFAYDIFLKS
ncbi:sulfite exporter TauE/SafE family protein [Pedobacter steynii]|uniref:Probable membrane transporter protein n=1 Tax=Pedobacter steynii TaxID=430522 RepID=A0A1D7QQT4_9SPHI|nr:TSUP family transporter [Pedobacter steynii]AOM81036.1 hypothetical protein BFS30_26515 [Pedobacter steynii]